MELKKCKNCGAFISSDVEFCSTCTNTLSYNKTILKGYFDSGITANSVSAVSSNTGVSPKIVESYMIENNYINSEGLEATSFASIPY